MFINRPHRPLPHNDHSESGDTIKDASEDSDFLANHGGKIALVGFSFAAALVYRWFKGGKNRTNLEEQITLESPLHPYESNDLRVKNSMTCSQFGNFEAKCRAKFIDGYATYDDFVLFFQQQQQDAYTIKEGYVIDRVILNFVEGSSSQVDTRRHDGRYPISFFLVALSNVVNASPDDRIVLLFDIAKHLSYEELQRNEEKDASTGQNVVCEFEN